MNRRWLLVPLLLLVALAAWRLLQPPPDDREVVLGEMEAIRIAALRKNPVGIVSRLSDDFRFAGARRDEIQAQLVGFFWSNDAVEPTFSNLQVEVEGDLATSTGEYTVRWRPQPSAPFQTRTGSFRAQWRKDQRGRWKIALLTGGEALLR
jgi:hypothetical protein